MDLYGYKGKQVKVAVKDIDNRTGNEKIIINEGLCIEVEQNFITLKSNGKIFSIPKEDIKRIQEVV